MRSRVHLSTERKEKDACLLLSSGPVPWQQEKQGPGFLAPSPEGMKIGLVNVVSHGSQPFLNPSPLYFMCCFRKLRAGAILLNIV